VRRRSDRVCARVSVRAHVRVRVCEIVFNLNTYIPCHTCSHEVIRPPEFIEFNSVYICTDLKTPRPEKMPAGTVIG
jgi:hypothetical protein